MKRESSPFWKKESQYLKEDERRITSPFPLCQIKLDTQRGVIYILFAIKRMFGGQAKSGKANPLSIMITVCLEHELSLRSTGHCKGPKNTIRR
jgi:hypothetical protein